eukprot:4228291-Lingulodinium_polyedra.AAC.1
MVVLKNGDPLPQRLRGASMTAAPTAAASSSGSQTESWQGYGGWSAHPWSVDSWSSWNSWEGTWQGWTGS